MSEVSAKKNIILVVGTVSDSVADTILDLRRSQNQEYRFALVDDRLPKTKEEKSIIEKFDIFLHVDFNSPKSIKQALLLYKDELLAVTCRAETNIPRFQKIVPHVPYLQTPTSESLNWSTNKVEMRRHFMAYDKTITPKYMVVVDATKKSIDEIEQKVGFPLIVKPSGLAASLLVSHAFHREELEEILNKVFKKIKVLNKTYKGEGAPEVLVEQFMDGSMYSVDAYVNADGKVSFCPFVSIKTGKEIGFDDFFGYQQMTPTKLNKESQSLAKEAAKKAIEALALRSTTAHIELFKTEDGWKIIEVGPRIGGFRHNMYALSYGINHAANDILVRIPKPTVLYKTVLGHTAVFKVFAPHEGLITTLTGIKKIQDLGSFHSININQQVGDKAMFAKHGGKSVFNVTFFNEDRSKLLADIRRMEKFIKIETSKN